MINKGRTFFGILLTLIIIVTLALLAYLAYDYISKYLISQEAAKVVDEFEIEIENLITVEISDENQIANEVIENTNTITNTIISNNSSNMQPSNVKYRGYNVIGTIQIPKTKVKYPIVDSTSSEAMDVAIVMLYGPGLNEEGNTVIVGHNYRNGGFFGNNKKLEVGDKIYITDSAGTKVEYTIYNKYMTTDSDFSYATRETNGKKEISLSTCTNDSSKRLVIWAKEN